MSKQVKKLPARKAKRKINYKEQGPKKDELVERIERSDNIKDDFYEYFGDYNEEDTKFIKNDDNEEDDQEEEMSSSSFPEDEEEDDEDELVEVELEEDSIEKKPTQRELKEQQEKQNLEDAAIELTFRKLFEGSKYSCQNIMSDGNICAKSKESRLLECKSCRAKKLARPKGISNEDWNAEKLRRKRFREDAKREQRKRNIERIMANQAKLLKRDSPSSSSNKK